MNNDVSAVLDRSDKIRCSEGVIDYKRKTVLVSDLCDCVDVRDVTVGIAKSLKVDGSCIFLDGSLNFCEVMCIYKSSCYTVLRKCVGQKVVAAAVDGLLSYNVATVCSKCLDGIGDGCCSGCNCKSCAAAFKSCDSLLENVLC